MLYDQQQTLAAAEVLQPAVDLIRSDAAVQQTLQQWRLPETIVSRMHFFYAMHFATEGNRDKQIQHLREGIAANPADADLLIAMFQLPQADDAWRQECSQLIKTAADGIHQRIEQARQLLSRVERMGADEEYRARVSSFLAVSCNQYAWLICNTQGDFHEALECSLESLRRMPDEGSFLDTLAHCYFAVGDLPNAVKSQTRAVELEPHSAQIVRKLEFFQKAAEQSKSRATVPPAKGAPGASQTAPSTPNSDAT